ncbi:MAG: twin-arginine translocation signal domain-containing protein [Mariniphaga sp.]|nr:twin-arginine translocation signal domain-containing protein [Mariniphaga sp.]MDD4226975.1 twin-arginine translocation signal domain-containing protein [Mariniphaga sp.]MDD4425777.1 twin-arginine translocation signal domain-containing protein [Mariniphaga sp.]
MQKIEGDTRRNFLKKAALGVGAGFISTGGICGKETGYLADDKKIAFTDRLLKNARIILETSCRAKKGESLLILADEKLLPYSPALVTVALELNLIPAVMDIRAFLSSPQYKEGYVLKPVAAAMDSSDIVLEYLVDTWIPNRPDFGRLFGDYTHQDKSLTSDRRWLIVQCDGMDKWNISSEEVANIRKRTLWLADLLKTAKSGRVTSANGTDLTFGLANQASYKPILGIVPLYGEVAVVPDLKTTHGVFYVDGPTQLDVRPRDELDREPLRITVEKGVVKDYSGDPVQVERLNAFIASGDPPANAIDEVGILTTKFKENDEYYWSDGTHHHDRAHIALGNNVLRDMLVHGPKHMDGEVSKPTIVIDGVVITKDGVFQDDVL